MDVTFAAFPREAGVVHSTPPAESGAPLADRRGNAVAASGSPADWSESMSSAAHAERASARQGRPSGPVGSRWTRFRTLETLAHPLHFTSA